MLTGLSASVWARPPPSGATKSSQKSVAFSSSCIKLGITLIHVLLCWVAIWTRRLRAESFSRHALYTYIYIYMYIYSKFATKNLVIMIINLWVHRSKILAENLSRPTWRRGLLSAIGFRLWDVECRVRAQR